MSEMKKPLDKALDLFVYAPLGFALEAKAMLPQFIERGHNQVSGQVTMAKMMGQFAVQQGQAEAEKRLGPIQHQAAAALADLGLGGKPGSAPIDATATEAPSAEPTPSGPTAVVDHAEHLSDADLAVPDYDGLAASQVIPRLAGLSAEELEEVRAYEEAKRGRKTILNKIAQLQAS